MTTPDITYFAKLKARLSQSINNSVDANPDDFRRPLSRCSVQCAGMCCYDGTFVEADEEELLRDFLERNRDWFGALVEMPENFFCASRWKNRGRQTVLVQHEYPEAVKMPGHFSRKTSCFLLTRDGKCALEIRARAEGRHRWFYKPMACWLFPIVASHDGKLNFRLYSEEDEPYTSDSYPGFISHAYCSRTNQLGRPANQTLKEELSYVEAVVGEGSEAARKLRSYLQDDGR